MKATIDVDTGNLFAQFPNGKRITFHNFTLREGQEFLDELAQLRAENERLKRDGERLELLAKQLGDRGSNIKTLDDIRQFADDLQAGKVTGITAPITADEVARLKRLADLVQKPDGKPGVLVGVLKTLEQHLFPTNIGVQLELEALTNEFLGELDKALAAARRAMEEDVE